MQEETTGNNVMKVLTVLARHKVIPSKQPKRVVGVFYQDGATHVSGRTV